MVTILGDVQYSQVMGHLTTPETRTFCCRSLSRRALQLGLAPKKSMVATEPFVDDFPDEARRDAENNWVMIKIESKCRQLK